MERTTEVDVTIDGSEWNAAADDVASCGDVLRVLEAEVARRGRCIGAVRLNGRELSRGDLDVLDGRDVAAGDRWDVATATLNEVLRDAIPNACVFVGDLASALEGAAHDLRWGDAAAAGEHWARCIDGLIVLNQLLAVVESARPALAPALADQRTAMTETLQQISSAQEEQDWVYVADLIEARLQPALDGTGRVLEELKAA